MGGNKGRVTCDSPPPPTPGGQGHGAPCLPARPEPWGQRAEEQVREAQPRQRRAAAAQVRPGPEEGRATGRGAPPPPPAWSLERRTRGAASPDHPAERCSRGSAVPSSWRRRGREKNSQADSEAGLFWRLETPRRVEGRSDTLLWPAARKGPSSKQPPAGRPEKPPAPGESGRVARRARARDLGEPWRVSAERSPRSSERISQGRRRAQQRAERPLAPVHTHPTRGARAAVRLWGRSFPGAFPPGSQHRWATGWSGGALGDVHIRHGGRVAALRGPA